MYNGWRRGPCGRRRSELGQDRKVAALRIQPLPRDTLRLSFFSLIFSHLERFITLFSLIFGILNVSLLGHRGTMALAPHRPICTKLRQKKQGKEGEKDSFAPHCLILSK